MGTCALGWGDLVDERKMKSLWFLFLPVHALGRKGSVTPICDTNCFGALLVLGVLLQISLAP